LVAVGLDHFTRFKEAPGSALAHRSSPGASGPLASPAQRERLVKAVAGLRERLVEPGHPSQ